MPKTIGNFFLKKGITIPQIIELINYSKVDTEIIKNTSDPKRFKNEKSFIDWQKKKRSIYTLVDEMNSLCGIMWFGRKDLPSDYIYPNNLNTADYIFTFAIRLYGVARGKKLAGEFMKHAFDLFTHTIEFKNSSSKGFWLEVGSDNLPAIKAYMAFGFEKSAENVKKGKQIMIKL